MNRKSFIKTALVAGTATAAGTASAKSLKNSMQKQHQEFYELQVYTLKNQQQQKLVEDYLQQAAIPALNSLGSKSIGVFTEMKPASDQTKIFVLIPYATLDAYLKVHDNLLKDAKYQQAGAPYLQAQATDPAYERIENSLLQAFSTTPKIMAPEKKERFF
ncbi:MAG: NIPSNAP family protein, partial [Janthinobacterium lividum]